MRRLRGDDFPVRRIKKRRARPARALTFGDLHAAQARERDTFSGLSPSSASNGRAAQQGGGDEPVVNHVLV